MIIDVIAGVILFISTLIALLRGFVKEVLTIMGLLGGLFAAIYFADDLQPTFRGWIVGDGDGESRLWGIVPYTLLADVLAYTAVFLGVVIILSIISHMISKAIKGSALGPIDRLFGVLFGLARGVLLLAILYLPFNLVVAEETKDEWKTGSYAVPVLEMTSDWLVSLMPEDVKEDSEEAVDVAEDVVEKVGDAIEEQGKAMEKPTGNSSPAYDESERQKMDNLIEETNQNHQ